MKIIWKKLWARKYSPFGMAGYILSFTNNPLFPKCLNKLALFEGKLISEYFAEPEFNRLTKSYISRLLKMKNLKAHGLEFEQQFKSFYDWAEKFSQQDFFQLSNREMAEKLKELFSRYVECGDWQQLVWPIVYGPQAELEAYFGNLPEGKKILEAIATPYKITKIVSARLELLRLAMSKKNSSGHLKALAKKYAWIPVYEMIDQPWGLAQFKKQLKQIKNPALELKLFLAGRKKSLRYYANYLKTIKDKRLKQKVEICHLFAYLKEMRDDYRRPAFYKLRNFWQNIAKRLNLSFEQTNFLICEELISYLRTGKRPAEDKINSRQQGYGLWLKNGKLKIYSGPAINRLTKFVVIDKMKTNVLMGVAANQGLRRGKVKIINHQSDFVKLKRGDILVTAMTHPEFVPIMRLAGAIVTDEGGITSHAAIVARELNKPCVIGTKIATKVFKNGDIIEVDANRGMVKKIK